MLTTIIKAIIMVYPFIREVILGKHSENKDFKWVKVCFIFIAIASIVANAYLIVATLNLGKEKLANDAVVNELKKKITNSENLLSQCLLTRCVNPNMPVKESTSSNCITEQKNKKQKNTNSTVTDILKNANKY
jgi:hypothetical protein